MRTITLDRQDICRGYLILVSKDFPLQQEEVPRLIPADPDYPDILIEEKAGQVLARLMKALNCAGEIVPVSGYRPIEEQRQIYADSLAENGQAFTQQYVALPGCSEHQTGLAIDLGKNQENIDFICPEFPYTGICQTFREAAVYEGFTERYQKGKEAVTGISQEPWHFRYVGVPHAQIMRDENLALEEYMDYLRNHPYEGQHLTLENHEIFYVDMRDTLRREIQIPHRAVAEISGDNAGGFIVTLHRE